MKLSRLAMLSVFLIAPLGGCGPHSEAPHMVGKEALDKLPKDENYKPSRKAKSLRVESAASSMKPH